MKTNELKILKTLMKVFLIVFMTFFILDIVKILFAVNENNLMYIEIFNPTAKMNNFIKAYIVGRILGGIFLFIGSLQLFKIISVFDFKTVYKLHYIKRFKKVSYFFIASSVFSFLSFIFKNISSVFFNVNGIYLNYFVLIIGFFFLLLFFVLKRARELKQENDLTI